MKRRTIVVNSVLAAALLGVGVVTVVSVAGGSERTAPTGTTVAVARGTVTSTVTATGNVEAGSTISVDTSASGTVTKIYAKLGQRVLEGDKLLKIDDTSARQSLKTAQSNLDSAEASLATTVQGRSDEDRAVDDAGVRSAQTSLDNARTALQQAKSSYALDQKQQNQLVDAAKDSLASAKQQKSDDEDDLDSAETDLSSARQAGDATAVTEKQNTVSQLTTSVASDKTAIDQAESGVTQARQTRDKTLLGDRQAIASQQGQVDAAADTLASQQAQRTANRQPARSGAIDSARAQVDSSEVAVQQAEQSLQDTTVVAPADGTVADISAVVGQSSSAAGTSSGATTDTGSSGAAGTSSSGTTSSSTGSGLVTLVNDRVKQVAAAVAEADIVKVKIGQSVLVAFPASNKALSGKVTSVATTSTVSNNVVQYDVAVSLPTADSSVRLGQTADVTITTGSHANVLYVPTSAITTTGSTSAVTRRSGGADSIVQVETGLVGATGTEIVRGLNQGDQLVLPTGTGGSFTFPGSSSSASSSASATPSTAGSR